jgi:hypothetical protein
MDTGLPCLEDIAMALPAELVGVFKFYRLSVQESEPVSMCRIMAVKAPSFRLSMTLDNDIPVEREGPLCLIGFHSCMACRTGIEL